MHWLNCFCYWYHKKLKPIVQISKIRCILNKQKYPPESYPQPKTRRGGGLMFNVFIKLFFGQRAKRQIQTYQLKPV